jgi:hypothetical protein
MRNSAIIGGGTIVVGVDVTGVDFDCFGVVSNLLICEALGSIGDAAIDVGVAVDDRLRFVSGQFKRRSLWRPVNYRVARLIRVPRVPGQISNSTRPLTRCKP